MHIHLMQRSSVRVSELCSRSCSVHIYTCDSWGLECLVHAATARAASTPTHECMMVSTNFCKKEHTGYTVSTCILTGRKFILEPCHCEVDEQSAPLYFFLYLVPGGTDGHRAS